ncbi:hypothetical protein NEIELOOT_00616 [Neisseria elongata subsp. glycolytica ATCC 29315]|uniref:Uncharacterized protein n=1 Tax=Neisseria elongata subsp. glycolytica ATCC 29315 TaxID=546263 RepID=D4DNI3_NEIEG|nr:hypothetical protein NEIELOOT_00616 [Neisseria elongata subsp. glycolytica ATCC 29315]
MRRQSSRGGWLISDSYCYSITQGLQRKIKENDKGAHYPTNSVNLKTKYLITYKN